MEEKVHKDKNGAKEQEKQEEKRRKTPEEIWAEEDPDYPNGRPEGFF